MTYLNTSKEIVDLCGQPFGKSYSGKIFFPYEFVPETLETTFTGVAFELRADIGTVPAYDVLGIYFYVYCHVGNAHVPELPGLRYDLIAHQIIRDFSDQPLFGIGKCQLLSNQPYYTTRLAARMMRGRVLMFQVTDFSQGLYTRKSRA